MVICILPEYVYNCVEWTYFGTVLFTQFRMCQLWKMQLWNHHFFFTFRTFMKRFLFTNILLHTFTFTKTSALFRFIKVFRLQRKTFLLFYCFFLFIKVFRFQRKTLLLLFAFSFFLLLFFLVVHAFFSVISRSIFVKFSAQMSFRKETLHAKFRAFFHFRSRVIALLVTF